VPADHPDPRTANAGGARTGRSLHFSLSPGIVRQVEALAAGNACTPFAVTHTAFVLWLARASQHTDLVVGVPSCGRPVPELIDTVGYFTNLMPLRTRIHPEQSFAETVRAVHAGVAAGLDHDLVPFDRIVKALGPGRRRGVRPLVQTTFLLVDDRGVGAEAGDWHGLQVEERRIHRDDAARFDLELLLRREGRDTIQAALTYDVALYRAETAEQARDDYCALLAALCQNPDGPVGPLLDGRRPLIPAVSGTAETED
jgi:non-ribosomal peptide synthetase component F